MIPAAASHGIESIPTSQKPKVVIAKYDLPRIPAKPTPAEPSKVVPPVIAAAPSAYRYSVRQWVAIAVGFLLSVALTAWNTVKVMASGPRDSQTIQAIEPHAQR